MKRGTFIAFCFLFNFIFKKAQYPKSNTVFSQCRLQSDWVAVSRHLPVRKLLIIIGTLQWLESHGSTQAQELSTSKIVQGWHKGDMWSTKLGIWVTFGMPCWQINIVLGCEAKKETWNKFIDMYLFQVFCIISGIYIELFKEHSSLQNMSKNEATKKNTRQNYLNKLVFKRRLKTGTDPASLNCTEAKWVF